MKTSFTSNLSMQNAMRLSIQQAQAALIKGQKEVTTGVYADLGVSLGEKTSRSLDLGRDVDRIASLINTNSIVTQRLEGSQEALETMSKSAQSILEALVPLSGNNDSTSIGVSVTKVTAEFSNFVSVSNTTLNGEYLFAGTNTDVKPMNDYVAGSPAKLAYDAALSTFMGAQVPPVTSVGEFSAAQMDDFITNTLEPMFQAGSANWDNNWSNAATGNMTSRISKTEVIDSSTTVDNEGSRYFALTSVIAMELMGADIPEDVRDVVRTKAVAYVGKAITGLDAQRSNLGISEARVEKATESLEAQTDIIKNYLSDLQGVDAYEASTRVTNLLSQIEASYTLTSRIQQLSLVNFL